MKYSLEIKEAAVADMQDAYDYYEEQKFGLGERFLDIVETYLERVQNYLRHYQIKRKPYREAFIIDFPFVVIYEIEESKIIVYSVFHTSKKPSKKLKK